MEIGDVMVPAPGSRVVLACGTGTYTHAICVSVEPFVMVSQAGDMIWTCQNPEHFIALCRAHPDATREAFARYNRER